MSTTTVRRALATGIAFAFCTPLAAAAPVFYESFDISAQDPPQPGCNTGDFPGGPGTYPFPAGWLLRNVDNRTPSAEVSYVNEAWEVREDFNFDVTQCAAFSTSWYSPAGAADDWAWTPPIPVPPGGGTLSWRAVAYDPSYRDGYEVRVMASPDVPGGGTGVLGNQVSSSTQIFSTAAEQTAWTNHGVDLAAYAGQTVYVGFHNNSVDKFLLLIDDVEVIDPTPNLTALPPSGYSVDYVRLPADFPAAVSFGVTAFNGGGAVLTNVLADVTVRRNGVPEGLPLQSNTIPSIAIGASAPVLFASGNSLYGNGALTFFYELSATETPSESDLADNVIEVAGTTIGGNEWTRYEGPQAGTLGIGAGNGGELGTQFTLTQAATFEGVRFGFADHPPPEPPGVDTWPGNSVVAYLRVLDPMSGKPADIIATTTSITTTTTGAVYDVWFTTGVQSLAPGNYVVTVGEPVGADAIPLILATDRYLPGTTWVNWPTSPSGDWAHFEDFGTSFAKTPYISLLTYVSLFKDGFENAPAAPSAASAAAAMPAHPAWPTRGHPLTALSQLPHD